MNTELTNLKKIVSDRRDSDWICMVDIIPHEVIGSIYTAIHTFDHDDFQSEEEYQNRAVMELEVKLRELLIAEFPEQLTNAVTYKEELDCDWLAFGLLCNPCYDGKPTVDDGAAMILLLAEALLKEVNKTKPNLLLTMALSVKIGRAEAFLATLKGASPMYEMRSYEQNLKAGNRKGGGEGRWHKGPVEEVISTFPLGITGHSVFQRLCALGDEVPHQDISSFERLDDDHLRIYPSDNEKNQSVKLKKSTISKYPRPSS